MLVQVLIRATRCKYRCKYELRGASTGARAQRAIFLAILGDFERFWQEVEADLQVLALKIRC